MVQKTNKQQARLTSASKNFSMGNLAPVEKKAKRIVMHRIHISPKNSAAKKYLKMRK